MLAFFYNGKFENTPQDASFFEVLNTLRSPQGKTRVGSGFVLFFLFLDNHTKARVFSAPHLFQLWRKKKVPVLERLYSSKPTHKGRMPLSRAHAAEASVGAMLGKVPEKKLV